MSIDEAFETLRTTNAYGTMDIAKGIILDYYANQKTVLEDIKAEIEKELCHSIRDEYSQRQNDYCDGVEFAGKRSLEIIDKHIGKENE